MLLVNLLHSIQPSETLCTLHTHTPLPSQCFRNNSFHQKLLRAPIFSCSSAHFASVTTHHPLSSQHRCAFNALHCVQKIQKQNIPSCCWRRTSRRSQAHLVRGALVMRSLPSPCPSNGLTWSDPGMGYGGILLIMYRFAWVGLICSHTVSTIFYAILNL